MTKSLETEKKFDFQIIRKHQKQSQLDLPEHRPEIVANQTDIINLFEVALENWLNVFESDKLKQTIQTYLSLEPSKKEQRTALTKYSKEVRKAGLILGSAYYFCNKKVSLPNHFIKFLKIIGQFHDCHTIDDQKSNKQAELLLKFLNKTDLIKLEFTATDTKTLEGRIALFRERVLVNLEKNPLTIHDYHKIRTDLRYVMNLYQVKAASNPHDNEVLKAFQYMCDLNSVLGDLHDVFVQQALLGITNYDAAIVNMPSILKNGIIKVCDFLE